MRNKNSAPPTRSAKIKSIVIKNIITLSTSIVLVAGAFLFYKFIWPSFGKKTHFIARYNESTQTYTISGAYFYKKGTLEIPSEYSDDENGTHPVTAIVGGVGDFIHGNGQIESLIIPDSVTSIGGGIFANCSSLKNVSIGNGVTYFGDDVFKGCDNLEYNQYDNGLYLGNDENPYLIFMREKDKEIESCEINDKARFIGSRAFEDCSALASVDIPDGITSIGRSAFRHCNLVKSVSLPGVTRIGGSAFSGCYSLEDVTIGANVTYIGGTAFEKCNNLKRVIFKNPIGWEVKHENITTIGEKNTKITDNVYTIAEIENEETAASLCKQYISKSYSNGLYGAVYYFLRDDYEWRRT